MNGKKMEMSAEEGDLTLKTASWKRQYFGSTIKDERDFKILSEKCTLSPQSCWNCKLEMEGSTFHRGQGWVGRDQALWTMLVSQGGEAQGLL